jgi:hypothetical protein
MSRPSMCKDVFRQTILYVLVQNGVFTSHQDKIITTIDHGNITRVLVPVNQPSGQALAGNQLTAKCYHPRHIWNAKTSFRAWGLVHYHFARAVSLPPDRRELAKPSRCGW